MDFVWISDDPWFIRLFEPIKIPPMPSDEEIRVTMEDIKKYSSIIEDKYGRDMVF